MAFKGAVMVTEKDNVATALENIDKGVEVQVRLGARTSKVVALEKIPFGFKIAIEDIEKGSQVIKYGESIGLASSKIKKGQQVHIHNIEGARGRGDLEKGD
jgi:altronate dehydratase small subunit